MRALHQLSPARQRGAALVEFALVAMIFFVLLIGIFEFGRVMFTWNSAVEATRRGARLAVVCDIDNDQIKAQMRSMLPVVTNDDILITYSKFDGSGCDADSCEQVTVSILPDNQTAFQYYIPLLNSAWKIPEFSTTLTRESLSSGTAPDNNPDCFPPPLPPLPPPPLP
jgi:Flp pilus assembly protein TadG